MNTATLASINLAPGKTPLKAKCIAGVVAYTLVAVASVLLGVAVIPNTMAEKMPSVPDAGAASGYSAPHF